MRNTFARFCLPVNGVNFIGQVALLEKCIGCIAKKSWRWSFNTQFLEVAVLSVKITVR